jgi:hypothetical protein
MLKTPVQGLNIFYTFIKYINDKLLPLKYLTRLFFLFLLAILSSCHWNKIPAHVIEYKVTYLEDKAGSIPTYILPGKMTVVFADHYALNRIEGFLGQFSLSFIANLRNRTVVNLVKIFDKKYVYYGMVDELPVCIAPIDSMKIVEEGKNIEFAGYSCRKLLITSSNHPVINVLCTDRIKVKNPNITTPYREINEVLLMFNTRLSVLEMKFTASKYEEKEVPREIFRVPDDYQSISKENLEQVIKELFK